MRSQRQIHVIDILAFAYLHGLIIIRRVGICGLDLEHIRFSFLSDPAGDHLGIADQCAIFAAVQGRTGNYIHIRIKHGIPDP